MAWRASHRGLCKSLRSVERRGRGSRWHWGAGTDNVETECLERGMGPRWCQKCKLKPDKSFSPELFNLYLLALSPCAKIWGQCISRARELRRGYGEFLE